MSGSSNAKPRTVTYKTTIEEDERAIGAIGRLLERVPDEVCDDISPLYEHVDPEALGQLFTNTNSKVRTGTATVTVGDIEIVIRDGERIEMRFSEKATQRR